MLSLHIFYFLQFLLFGAGAGVDVVLGVLFLLFLLLFPLLVFAFG